MIEVGSDNLKSVKCHIAPDRTPEAGSIDRNHGYSVLEDVNRELEVRTVLDLVVLGFQVSGAVNLGIACLEASHLLSGCIDQYCFADVLLVEFEDGGIAGLLIELSCGENLADGFSLLVGYLHRLQGLRDESKDSCYQYTNHCCVHYGIYVTVCIHNFRFFYALLSFLFLALMWQLTTIWSMRGAKMLPRKMASIIPSA